MQPKEQLKILGINYFCELIRKGKINLRKADLRGAYLYEADLRGADLRGTDLRGADLDFSCLPLWCGSSNIKIDERLAKQFLAHAFHLAQGFCEPTEKQKVFCNDFHRIKLNEFPRIE